MKKQSPNIGASSPDVSLGYEKFFNLSVDMLCIADFNGYFKHLNSAWERALGWKQSELLEKPYLDFVHPDDHVRTKEIVQKLGEGEHVVRFENRYRAKDGSYRWIQWSAAPEPKEDRIYAVARDVTEQRNIESRQRDSEMRFRAILDNAPAVIYIKDAEGKLILINKRCEELFHLENEQVQGKTDYDFFPKEIADAWRENDREVLRTGIPRQFEERVTQEGSVRTYLSIKFPLHDYLGNPYAICGISTDITHEKEIEALKLKSAQELYQHLFTNVPDVIFTVTPAGVITSLNPAFETTTGWHIDDWLGKECLPLFHPDDVPLVLRDMYSVVSGHTIALRELRVRKKSGEYGIGEFTLAPLEENGKVVSMLGIARDVTEKRRLEQVRDEENIIKAKEAFLFRTIHDLRAPTTIIHLLLREYRSGGLAEKYPEMQESFNLIQEANAHMVKLIEYLVDFAKGTQSEIVLKKDLVDIKAVVGEALRELAPMIADKNIRVTCNEASLPVVVGDERALKEIFMNLIENAVKYNKENGSIIIKGTQHDSIGYISVEDTGVGIAEEHMPKLFTSYFRAYRGADIQGTGLGLFIIKGLIQKMGGRVEVASVLGQGSTFTVSLPGATHTL